MKDNIKNKTPDANGDMMQIVKDKIKKTGLDSIFFEQKTNALFDNDSDLARRYMETELKYEMSYSVLKASLPNFKILIKKGVEAKKEGNEYKLKHIEGSVLSEMQKFIDLADQYQSNEQELKRKFKERLGEFGNLISKIDKNIDEYS